MSALLSVIILTANRRPLLEKALRSLLAQTRRPDEVVVIDNQSTDDTAAFLAATRLPIPMVVVAGPGGSYAEARNAGVAAAKGELLLFLDDDCDAEAHLVERMEARLEAGGLDAVGGVLLPADELEAPDGYGPEMNWAVGLMDESIFGRLAGRQALPTTAALLVRREALAEFPFQEIGGEFGSGGHYGYGREDAEWWRRLRRAGRPVAVEPRAIAWHAVPQSRLDLEVIRERARSDGRAHWRREHLADEVPSAARDLVRAPIAFLTDAFHSPVRLRDAFESHRLWAARQAAFLQETVEDEESDLTAADRMRALLKEGGRALGSVAKATVRTAAAGMVTGLRTVRPVPTPADKPERLLVVLHDFLGDSVLALPLVRQFAAAFPKTRISLLTGPTAGPLLRENVPSNVKVLETTAAERGKGPRALKQLAARLDGLEPDAVLIAYSHGFNAGPLFFLEGAPVVSWTQDNGFSQRLWADLVSVPVEKNFRKAEVAALLDLLAPFGVPARLERPTVVPGAKALERRAGILAKAGVAEKAYVAVHFEPTGRSKFWPADRMAEVVGRLAEELPVFLVGSREGRMAWESTGLASDKIFVLNGLLDSAELAAMLGGAAFFLGCDSGPAHVAQAVGTPSLLLFGATEVHRWGPMPQLAGESSEPPFWVLGAAQGDLLVEEMVGLESDHCLRLLPLETVWEAVRQILLPEEKGFFGDKTH